jgi:hypothetical protein
MAMITNATAEWQAASATATREGWQVRAGAVLVTTDASPSGSEGLYLRKNDYIEFATGMTVSYRLAPGETAASIYRTTVG